MMSSDAVSPGPVEPGEDLNVAGSVPSVPDASDSVDVEETASDSSSTATAAEEASGTSGETEQKPQRRVQLKPTVGMESFKAIPSTAPVAGSIVPPPETVAEPAASSASVTAAGNSTDAEKQADVVQNAATPESSDTSSAPAVAADASKPVVVPATPVAVPDKNVDLDAVLEAEIEAALAADSAMSQQAAASEAEGAAEQSVPSLDAEPEEGARIQGTIQSLHGDDVFVDIGFRAPGVVSLRQFSSSKPPVVGARLEVVVARLETEDGVVLCNLPTGTQRIAGNWNSVEAGQIVECLVTKTNKGGLEVQLGGLRGFLPAGQVDLGYVDDLEPYVGQKLRAKIIEANREKRNLVLSRRALLQEEREAAQQSFWETIEVGHVFSGTIKTLKEYGAFVDMGAVDGFIHIGQLSWSRIKHPSEVVQEGQHVDVKVISIDHEKQRIGLSLKQMEPNPWSLAVDKYPAGKTVNGKVTRTESFGAFVELEPGVEGLVHISELDYKRVKRVTDVLDVGQKVDVQVISVDPEKRRISLSVKALKEKPPEETGADAEDATSAKEDSAAETSGASIRSPRRDLKGGTGSPSGLLFGNPQDYD